MKMRGYAIDSTVRKYTYMWINFIIPKMCLTNTMIDPAV